MSRVGKEPIVIPKGMEVSLADSRVVFTYKSNTSYVVFDKGVKLNISNYLIKVEHVDHINKENISPVIGLTRTNIYNVVCGLVQPFKIDLKLKGVGYKCSVIEDCLILSLGYSHDIIYIIPKSLGVEIECNKGINITISGRDKSLVGNISEKICSFRKYDPYKGKGVISNNIKYSIRKTASKK